MKITIPDFSQSNVLVVGDVMLDRYWMGDTSRISPEAPVPVVRVKDLEDRPGGAANVALNVAALGGQATLGGVVGADEHAQILNEHLKAAGVITALSQIDQTRTITKLRVLSRNQQLIRLDFEDRFEQEHSLRLRQDFNDYLGEKQVVVLSDYAKGTLDNCAELIAQAKQKDCFVLVDPKHEDLAYYQGADLITPNWHEFEAAVGPCANETEIVEKGQKLMLEAGFGALLVTRGEHGMTLLQPGKSEMHLPARAREVYDVTGAGDTVISVLAASLSAGQSLEQATALANVAAGIVVGKLGTAVVTLPELRSALRASNEADVGAMTEEQLLYALRDAKMHGEKIVMTNGCFDIMHAGHVTYLQQAKALGDRLIVAVNSDASVKGLKGPGRPVNNLERRMAVLAALGSVDWVVSFDEETPARLIGKVLPDVLVKGGDYKPEDIAGGDAVIANGGEVKVLDFIDGISTTGILEAYNKQTDQ